MKIALVGGGTGGHIFPIIAVVEAIREKIGADTEFVYFGSGSELEQRVMKRAGIGSKHIISGKFRRYVSFRNVIDFFKLPIGIVQSLWLLLFYMPDAVFSKGGYASVPVIVVAWLYRIPILIHESDARPGLANRWLARLAKRVAISYPTAAQYFPAGKTALTGVPVNNDLLGGSAVAARTQFHLSESKPTVLVLGGSQGSQAINRAVVKILPKLLFHAQVIHQTGEANYERIVHLAAEYGAKPGYGGYITLPFIEPETLKDVLALADAVVSRAGATSIAEIAANGKPSILVPLASAANDHQRMNAYEIAAVGGALVLEESNLGETILFENIEKILFDQQLKTSIAEKIRLFYHPEAAEKIATGLIEIIR